MASLAWQTIPDTDIDEESIVSEALIGKFHDNQECLISQNVETRFTEETHSGGFTKTTVKTGCAFWVPPGAATTDGSIELVVSIDCKIDDGAGGAPAGTMTVFVDINGNEVSQSGIADGTYTRYEFRFNSTITRAMDVGNIDFFDVKIQLNGSGDRGFVKCENGASRLERVA